MFHSFRVTFAQVLISKRASKVMHHSLAKQDTLVLNVTSDILQAVAQLAEALCYKQEGRGFDSRLCHWNFSLT
jgi:hypothetical protein